MDPFRIAAPDPSPPTKAPPGGPPPQPQQPPAGKDGTVPWAPAKSDPYPFKL